MSKGYSWGCARQSGLLSGIIVYFLCTFLIPKLYGVPSITLFESLSSTPAWFENLLIIPYSVIVAWFFYKTQHKVRVAGNEFLILCCVFLLGPFFLWMFVNCRFFSVLYVSFMLAGLVILLQVVCQLFWGLHQVLWFWWVHRTHKTS